MPTNNTRASLPRTGSKDQVILDRYGNRWAFDEETKGWISKGVVSSPAVVSEDKNGLVTPDILSKLTKLRQYVTNNKSDLTPLKLLPGRTGYWYYFKTSDKLYRFRPEGNDTLRIEVDKGRLYQLLSKSACPGKLGLKGPTGETGAPGRKGTYEPCFSPSNITSTRLDFAIFTPTPLTNAGSVPLPNEHVPEISVRLYKITATATPQHEDQLHAQTAYYRKFDTSGTVLPVLQRARDLAMKRSLGIIKQDGACNVPLSPSLIITNLQQLASVPSVTIIVNVDQSNPKKSIITVSDPSLDIDLNKTIDSIQFDIDTNIVCGSIYLSSGSWIDEWCIKSRQKGPDGEQGDPGECRVKIVECTIDDTNILATCPVVNVRVDCDRNTLYTLCSNVIDENTVDRVALIPDSGTLNNQSALKSKFAAAQMILDNAKRINIFEIALEDGETPELDLIHWEPQPGCLTQRHYDRYKFDWVPLTDIPACDATAAWFSPTSVRPGRYPYELVVAASPPEDECCQDNFFYCPNIQDGPCPGESPSPPPSPSTAAVNQAAAQHLFGVNATQRVSSFGQGTRRWNVKS